MRAIAVRVAAVIGTSVILLAGSAAPAFAHAELIRSDPVSGAVLSRAPRVVSLFFEEALLPSLSSARLLDSDGAVVEGTRSSVVESDPTILLLDLPDLGSGRYSVLWQNQSADDGHLSSGGILFTVGIAGTAGAGGTAGTAELVATAASSSGAVAVVDVLRTWVALVALSSVVGGLAVWWFVLPWPRPGTVGLSEAQSRLRSLIRVGAWAGCAATLVDQALHIAVAIAAGLPWASTTATLLAGSSWGYVRLLRIACFAAVLLLTGRDMTRRMSRRSAVGASFVAVATLAMLAGLDGHSAAVAEDPAGAVIADAAHALAAWLWIGGLFGLLMVLVSSPAGGQLVRANRVRWSTLFGLSSVTLVVSGLYEVGRQVDTVHQLVDTRYGAVVLIKSAMFVAMALLGLRHFWLLHRHRRGSELPRRSVISEAATGVLVLLLAGLLVGTTPPRALRADPAPELRRSTSVADLVIDIAVSPDRPGFNAVSLAIASTRRPAPAPIDRVDVYVDSSAGEPLILRDVGDGRYYAVAQLAEPGRHAMQVVVHRHGALLLGQVWWTMADPATPAPLSSAEPQLASWTDPMALIGLAVLDVAVVVLIVVAVRRRRVTVADPISSLRVTTVPRSDEP